MHYLGMVGHMRRIYDPYQYKFLAPLQPMNQFITVSALVLGTAQILFLLNFVWSALRGRKVGPNPWGATGIEWTAPSPPPHGNWPGEIPEVHRWPYDYSAPGAVEDYVMQTDPAPVGQRAAGAH
jgi:cytochrome c oxidase subunit 1